MKNLLIGIIHHSSFMAERAIDSLLPQLPEESTICLLNNPLEQDYVKALENKYKDLPVEIIYRKRPKGFAENMNYIFHEKGYEYKYFMPFNDDAIAGKDLLERLLNCVESKGVSVGCPKILNLDGSIQPVYGPIPNIFSHISRHLKLKLLLRNSITRNIFYVVARFFGVNKYL